MELSPEMSETIRRALKEDLGGGDATSESIIPPDGSTVKLA